MLADEARSLIQESIDKAESAVGVIRGPVKDRVTEVVALIAQLKGALDRLSIDEMNVHQETQMARNSAHLALAASGDEAQPISFFGQVIEKSDDDVKKVRRIVELLEGDANMIIQSFTQSNEESAGKLTSAVGYLNQYLNSI